MATSRKRKMPITDVDALQAPIPLKPAPTIQARVEAPGFFQRVRSNVKMREMEVPLGPCTAIVSERNRAGKTAVLDAFRLGLTGKHPVGPHAADLAGLTVDGSYPWVKLTGGSASTHFRFEGGRKTPDLSLSDAFANIPPEKLASLLPMVSVSELLSLGTAKAREEVFRRFGGVAMAADVKAPVVLTEEQLKLWQQATAYVQGSALDKLTGAGTWLRSFKSQLSGRIRALEAEQQKLREMQAAAAAGTATDDLIRTLQAKLNARKKWDATHLVRERLKVSEERLLKLVEEFKALPPEVSDEELMAQVRQLTESPEVTTQEMRVAEQERAVKAATNAVQVFTLTTKLRTMLHGGSACLICERPSGELNVEELEQKAKALLEEHRALLENAKSRLLAETEKLQTLKTELQRRVIELQSAHSMQRSRRDRLKMDLRVARDALVAGQQMAAEAGATGEPPPETQPELTRQLEALNVAKVEAGRSSQLAAELRELSIEMEDVKTVEKEVSTAIGALVGVVAAAANEAVNRWMPPDFKAVLMLADEEDKPVCRWEIIGTDGRPHPRGAMSGAEWAALTVAIACAWTEGQEYRFLLLDDADIAGFNPTNLRATLTMLAKAVQEGKLTQVLVAWSRPEEIPTQGWSVVSL